ncbi:bifunctional adenosylcobinamide kinase/adenosylcobinamide-phosphate guanylyltransferase [uncultured Veillonella sp.]|uniref:bifunctional adenosylcobinamide kinase/adenosylcobinamide-phosphate guanylyltransferase n=1 Tax=uncultured Veillonella sp. TaxID=159268 RepID=UPI002623A23D|nr:bifunctional adenosylcobinamide kinase/adenosylcobinamide-phosphate guanylyltransferase [uncultured Veillonella sp.]
MSSKIILCTGGARSGKSEFAEALANQIAIHEELPEYTHKGIAEQVHKSVPEQTHEGVPEHTHRGTLEQTSLVKGGHKVYVATGQAFDEEMVDRIKKHKVRRGESWTTFELPHMLQDQWSNVLAAPGQVILVDCLTMYVTNALLRMPSMESVDLESVTKELCDDLECIIEKTHKANKTLIFVTNEVGQGIVPDNALSRHFRDISGIINQRVAALADEVYLTVSGITIEIKARQVNVNTLI